MFYIIWKGSLSYVGAPAILSSQSEQTHVQIDHVCWWMIVTSMHYKSLEISSIAYTNVSWMKQKLGVPVQCPQGSWGQWIRAFAHEPPLSTPWSSPPEYSCSWWRAPGRRFPLANQSGRKEWHDIWKKSQILIEFSFFLADVYIKTLIWLLFGVVLIPHTTQSIWATCTELGRFI